MGVTWLFTIVFLKIRADHKRHVYLIGATKTIKQSFFGYECRALDPDF
jgi:hypothetical protein